MGRGGEKSIAAEVQPPAALIRRNSWSFGSIKGLVDLAQSTKDDLTTLRHLWFSNLAGSKKSKDHAARLEQFYGPQAASCELRGLPFFFAALLLLVLLVPTASFLCP